jgi:hypothetical protein
MQIAGSMQVAGFMWLAECGVLQVTSFMQISMQIKG